MNKILLSVFVCCFALAVQARETTVAVSWDNGKNTDGTVTVGQVSIDGAEWQELFRAPFPANSFEAKIETASGVNLCVRVRAEKTGFDPSGWSFDELNCRVAPHDEALQQSTVVPIAWNAKDYNTHTATDRQWVLKENMLHALPKFPAGDALHARYTSIDDRAPVLVYKINFRKTGTHYLWINAPSQTSDKDPHNSVHVQLGTQIIEGIQLNNWTGTKTNSGERLAFAVSAVGEQDLKVYMREDGTRLIGFVITDNVAYIPDGRETMSARTLLIIPGSVKLEIR